MFKKFKFFLFTLFLINSTLFGGEITLLTSKLVRDGNISMTSGGVSIFNDGLYIYADEAIFLDDKKKIELYGNVVVKRGGKTEAVFEYLSLDIATNTGFSDNMIIPTGENGIWIMADTGESLKNGYSFGNFASSSCSIESPDWTIKASSGSHETEAQWLHLYNPTFYAGQIPVFYLPYFAYPTDTRRRFGLLQPVIGKSTKEGFIYEQPIYFAPHDSFDLELRPQIRDTRGSGTSGVFRFADSPTSSGYLMYGEFTDKKSFQEEYNLKENKHTGLRAEYGKNRIFATGDSKDGLYFKWEEYSDVDYIKLESAKNIDNEALSQIITNEFDYSYSNYDVYFGLRGKLYKDILDPDRKDLLNIYPIVEGHKFTKQLFFDQLTYSLDIENKEYTREENITASGKRVTLPLAFHGSFFDDYLSYKLSYNSDLYRIDYKKSEGIFSDNFGERFTTYGRLGLFTNLTKQLDKSFHNINFNLGYTLPGEKREKGVLHEDFVTFSTEKEGYDLKFTQYLYDNNYRTVFSQRLNQDYQKVNDNNWSLSDLEHEVTFSPYSNFLFSNTVKYSHEYDVLYSNSNKLTLNGSIGKFTLNYLLGHNKTTKEKDKDYYTATLESTLDGRNTITGSFEYDQLAEVARKITTKYTHNKNCWGISLSFARNITPFTTTTGTSSRINDTIYLNLSINPLGGQSWQVYEDEREN